jgi:hypothetical protein
MTATRCDASPSNLSPLVVIKMLTMIIALFMLGYYKNSRIPTSWNGLVKSLWDQLSPTVKRLTIAMTDELYLALLQYSADESRKAVRKVSLGKSMRILMSSRLDELGYRE